MTKKKEPPAQQRYENISKLWQTMAFIIEVRSSLEMDPKSASTEAAVSALGEAILQLGRAATLLAPNAQARPTLS